MTHLKFPSGEEMHLDMAANQPMDKAGKFASNGGAGAAPLSPSVSTPLTQKGTNTSTLKFAHEVGKGLAVSGASLNDVHKYLDDVGMSRDSISGRRILKAYHDQKARG